MTAYYNEFDPFAAAWLRELITEGVVAPGIVDERPIQEVMPGDLEGFDQCHFFAGIGGWSVALRLAGWADDRPVWTGSCPCQPFSSAGKQKGGADDRHLWPTWFRLIRECRHPVVFGEQVASAIGHGWLDLVQDDLEAEGYAVGSAVLPACSVGAFHKRDRAWFVADTVPTGWTEGRPESGFGQAALRRPPGPGGLADTEHTERRAFRVDRHDGCDGPNEGREEAHRQPRARSEVCGLDDAASPRRTPALEGPESEARDAARLRGSEPRCAVGGLADTDGGITGDGHLQRRRQHGQQPQDGGIARGLADRDSQRRDGESIHLLIGGSQQAGAEAAGGGANGGMGHADNPGPQGHGRHVALDGAAGREVSPGHQPASGIWDVRWHLCRDGKVRPVPVEPGVLVVLDGLSALLGDSWLALCAATESEVTNYATATQSSPREVVRTLWYAAFSQAIWGDPGGHDTVPRAQVLLLALCEHARRLGLLVVGATSDFSACAEATLRVLWPYADQGAAACAPPERGLVGSSAGEPADPVCVMPLEPCTSAACGGLYGVWGEGTSPEVVQQALPALEAIWRSATGEAANSRHAKQLLAGIGFARSMSAFPLVDGVQRGRVGILRGAGNAIVPPLAAEFIKAYLEC